ncbi:MAG: hypothetical protein EOM50_19360, partial [Erysipelotrichia bacterium]|nr:hypothetical protein [Erysipelotrichia bacterium]
MALNCTELLIIESVLKKDCKSKVGCFGYPDLLITKEQLEEYFSNYPIHLVKKREDSVQVARDHGREVLKNWVPESYSFFEMLGVELVVFDFKKWNGEEVILNLNDPVDTSLYQAFDLLIDPGTTEHVFNIAQAMKSIAMMVNVGGYIYHQTPLVHINHGFYNLSPTFYSDFYKLNGFDIKELKYFSKSLDAHGFMVAREDLDPYATFYEVKS